MLLMSRVQTVDEVVAEFDRVTRDDILRVGSQFLSPEKATLAAVGPFEDDAVFAGLI